MLSKENESVFDEISLQKLYRYACTLCISQDDAYDLLHYALEKYLRQPLGISIEKDLAYVNRIMRNRFIDQYRKAKRFPEEVYDDESIAVAIDMTSLEDIVVAQVDLELIWHKLDSFEREILYYWAVEEMTAQELSVYINVPRGTILSRIYRIRKKIETEKDSGKVANTGGQR